MATSYVIQNNSGYSDNLCVDSDGRIYYVYNYEVASIEYLTVAYSDDSGQTWTEVKTVAQPASTSDGAQFISFAIDSADTLHISYATGGTSAERTTLYYRTFSNGAFSGVEEVHNGANEGDAIGDISLAVDSADKPHIAWASDDDGTEKVFYSNRVSGSWAAREEIEDNASNGAQGVTLVLDSNNYRYIFYTQTTFSSNPFWVAKYTSFWQTPIQLLSSSIGNVGAVVDSDDNVHVVVEDAGEDIWYFKYTIGTDSWSAGTEIYTDTSLSNIFLGINSSDVLILLISGSGVGKIMTNTAGVWSSATEIIANAEIGSFMSFQTPIYPKFEGVSSQIPISGYQVVYDGGVGGDQAKIHISDGLLIQPPLDKNYSRGDQGSLPSSDTNLESLFTTSEYAGVLSDDNNYVAQSATNEYTIAQFKNKAANSSDEIHVSWRGKSSLSPSASPVVLQIYNRSAGSWETLTSDSATPADTEFVLTSSKTTNLNQYYDGNNWVAFRVYQLAQ